MGMTIRKVIYYLLLVLLFTIFNGRVAGQDSDFGLWYSFNADHSFTKKIDMSLKASLRTYENASVVDEAYLEGELSYSFNKYLTAAASGRIAQAREQNDEYHMRYKYFLGLRGKLPVERFTLSARTMLMVIHRSYVKDEDDISTFSTLRLKIKAAYNIKGFPMNPYIGIETFTKITVDSENVLDKTRLIAGAEYKISKKHALELEYMLDRDMTPDLLYTHLISTTYILTF